MAVSKKFFKDLKNEHLLVIVGLLFLFFFLYQYSNDKNTYKLGMTPLQPANVTDTTSTSSTNGGSSSITGANSASTYAPYNGATTTNVSNSATTSTSMNKAIANPSDLLPADSNNAWASMNPTGDLNGINLLDVKKMAGINTQGGTLRNANLQIRSEPANPRTATNCPWNVSTIETDTFRKPLEIGSTA